MAVPRRVHEAQQSRPAEQNSGPIHYSASIGAGDARGVRRIRDAQSRRFAADIKDSGGGPFTASEVIAEALALGLHFMALQYLGDPRVFDAAGVPASVQALDTATLARRKP